MPPDQSEARARVAALAEAKGVNHRELAEMAGLPIPKGQLRISRWFRGKAAVDDECVEKMMAGLETIETPASVDTGSHDSPEELTADAIRQRAAELVGLAGEPPQDTPESAELIALAKIHRRAAVGVLVKLAVSARSETTRLKAATELLDRADGRPTQTVRDLTERAPVEDAELLDMLSRLIAQKLIARAGSADAAGLDALMAEAAGLPEDHAESVGRAVAERRKVLAGLVEPGVAVEGGSDGS